jgi:Na+-driven multidrug efflux pump
VLTLAHSVLIAAIVLETARPINIIAGSALRASGDAIYTSLMGSSIMFLWSVPAVYFFSVPLEWGLVGVWFGMATDEMIRSFVNYRRWKKGRWKQTGIAVQPHQEASYAEKMS